MRFEKKELLAPEDFGSAQTGSDPQQGIRIRWHRHDRSRSVCTGWQLS